MRRNSCVEEGYIVMDPDTGAGGYMISGGLSGGGSVVVMNLSDIVWATKNIVPYYKDNGALVIRGSGPPKDTSFMANLAFCGFFLLGYGPIYFDKPSDSLVLTELEKNSGKAFYFAGHGAAYEIGLKPSGWTSEGEIIYTDTGLLDIVEIREFRDKYNYKFVMLNSCYSGDLYGALQIGLWDAFGISANSQTGCYLGWSDKMGFSYALNFNVEFWLYITSSTKTIRSAVNAAHYKRNLKIYGNADITLK